MKYLTLLFVFISSLGYSQRDTVPEGTYGVDYNVTDSQGRKQGKWVRVYENGSIYYAGQFKNSQPIGVFNYYYEGAGLMTIATHSDNGITESKSYRKDGSVVSVGKYKDQKKTGEWLLYDEGGKLIGVDDYEEDVLHGKSSVYYKNGQLAEKYSYDKGDRHGPWEEHFMDGKLKGQGDYSNGKLHGPILTYQDPGIKLYEGQLKDGVAVGEWRYYIEDGRLQLRILYDDFGGEIRRKFENGEKEEFFDSGIPKSYYEFRHGKLHGPFEEYYDKGDFVMKEITSLDLSQPLEFKESLENTQLKIEGEYRMGELEGEIIYYNEDGTIEKKEFYESGILVEE